MNLGGDERSMPADPFADSDEELVGALVQIGALLALLARLGTVIAVGVWVLVIVEVLK